MGSLALSVLLGGLMSQAKPSIPMDYCASINTGGSANFSTWQSDGLCNKFCLDDNYALAIVQGQYCWCSNYVPDKSKQVGVSKCAAPCPGYTDDVCGGDGTFGYMTLANAPSGTTGGSTPGKTSSPPSGDSNTTPTPSIRTVTQGGTVSTVTVLPSTPADSAGAGAGAQTSTDNKKGLSTGGAVGIAVGLVGAAAAGIIIFVVFRRRRRQHDDDDDQMDGHSPRGSSAGMTQSSKVPEVGVTPPYLGKMEGPWESDQSGRRRSMLMPIDPRIDPGHSGIYNRADNKSRDSINTLRDDQDYSRRVHQPTKVLRATNPDPDDDD